MALVVTEEVVRVPKQCLGIVFGTNRLTQDGLLIVNPGVITSGHSREITFFVMNFSKNELRLWKGDPLARILFLRSGTKNTINPKNVATSAHRDAENVAPRTFFSGFQDLFGELVRETAEKIIKRVWKHVWFAVPTAAFAFLLIVSFIAVIGPTIAERMSGVPGLSDEIGVLRDRITKMEARNKNTSAKDLGAYLKIESSQEKDELNHTPPEPNDTSSTPTSRPLPAIGVSPALREKVVHGE